MQILITHGHLARSRVLHFSRWQLVVAASVLCVLLLLLSGAIYHYFFLKAAREGWPVVSPILRLVVRDEVAQRERFMRENLDAMAQRVGEMQAKLVKLESMGDRVSGMAGLKPDELKPLKRTTEGGKGGLYVPFDNPSLQQLGSAIDGLDEDTDTNIDVFTLIESRLLEKRLRSLLMPNSPPVDGPVGSGFGIRTDPLTGRAALHTGLDFPSPTGTPVEASAGGVVAIVERHPQYGQMIEIDHGNGLRTRYAHMSKFLVKVGDIVKRGQLIGLVGSTGRSTGPHLHFEVLVDGSPQNPERFLAGAAPLGAVAQRSSPR